ncbi:MAG: hypothetical protein ACREJ2_13435 [Planctomycetota bacterium]
MLLALGPGWVARAAGTICPVRWFEASLAAGDAQPPSEDALRQQILDAIHQAQAARARADRVAAAQQMLQAGHFQQAAAALQALIHDQPEPALEYNLGRARFQLHDDAGARSAFLAALDLDPTLAPAQRGLGAIAFRAANYVEALKWWEPLLTGGARDTELLLTAGQCYYFTHRRRAALACFDAAAPARPDDSNLERWQIFCAADIGDDARADRAARDFLATHPADAAIRRIAARSAAALGRRDDAILQLERLRLNGKLQPADWSLLSDLYAARDDAADAADCLAAAAPAAATRTPAFDLRLGRLAERAGREDEARACYSAVPAAAAEYPPAQLGEARLLLARHDDGGAIAAAQAALGARPDLAEAHLVAAQAHEDRSGSGDAAAAQKEYLLAGADPEFAGDADLGLARLAYLAGRLPDALRFYRAAADLRPDDRALAQIVAQLAAHLQAAAATAATAANDAANDATPVPAP